MNAKKILTLVGILGAITSGASVHDMHGRSGIGFGFGVGGGGGGFSFGVGSRPYGYYGGRYEPWGYDSWDYYPSQPTYVVKERPIQVDYVTRDQQRERDAKKLDRQGRSFWRVSNKTDQNIKVSSDISSVKLLSDGQPGRLYRESSSQITVKTENGQGVTFRKVNDHHVDVTQNEEDEIELETWNQ